MANDAFGSLYIAILPDLQKKKYAELGSQMANNINGTTVGNNVGKSMMKAISGIVVGLGAVVAGVGITDFLKDAAIQASDFIEKGTAIEAVYGEASKRVQELAVNSATQFGSSKNELLQAAQMFGVYGKSAGMNDAENYDFAETLIKRTTDISAFYNKSFEEVQNAVNAGLRGEYEPLRQFGVLLSEATLKQVAMNNGMIKSMNTVLTPQQRVLAAYELILNQTSVTEGNFKATYYNMAQQLKVFGAQWANFKTEVGKLELPFINKLLISLNNGLFPELIKLITWFGTLFPEAVVYSEDNIDGLGSSFVGLADRAIKSFESIAQFIRNVSVPIENLKNTIASIKLPDFLTNAWETFSTDFSVSYQAVFGEDFNITTLINIIGELITWFAEVAQIFGKSFGAANDADPTGGSTAVFTTVFEALQSLLPDIQALVEEIAILMGTISATFWDALKTLVPLLAGILAEYVIPLLIDVLQWFNALPEDTKAIIFKSIFAMIALGAIIQFLTGGFITLLTALGFGPVIGVLSSLLLKFTTGLKFVGTLFKWIWTVAKWLAVPLRIILGFLRQFVVWLFTTSGAWMTLLKVLAVVGAVIWVAIDMIKGLWFVFQDGVTALDDFKRSWEQLLAGDFLGALGSFLMGNLRGIAGMAMLLISDVLSMFFGITLDEFTTWWNDIMWGFSLWMNDTYLLLAEGFNDFMQPIYDFFNAIGTGAETMRLGAIVFYEAGIKAWNDLVKYVQDTPGRVGDWTQKTVDDGFGWWNDGFGDIFGMATGGTVMPTPGGTTVRVAEMGRPESIVDTGRVNKSLAQTSRLMGQVLNGSGGNNGVTINDPTFVITADPKSPKEQADEFFKLVRKYQK